jgi:hypothetical protein
MGLITISGTGNMTLIDGPGVNSRRVYTQTGGDIRAYASGAAVLTVAQSPTSWRRLEVEFNGASGSLRVNDFTPATGDIGATASNGLTMAALAGGAAVWSDCRIAEVIEYNRILTGAEATQVRSYLTTRYGI